MPNIVKIPNKVSSPTPPTVSGDDVRFYDYDGTILHSYSKDEFLALTEMPANPNHNGLVAQGWNWTLSDAQDQVAECGVCDIGQAYLTESGNTEIDVVIDNYTLDPYLSIAVNGSIEINWGDGSTNDTITGSSNTTLKKQQHIYAQPGNYTIQIIPISGTYNFYYTTNNAIFILSKNSNSEEMNRKYINCIKSIRIGNNLYRVDQCAFRNCYEMQYITLPYATNIGNNAFENCISLKYITIPAGSLSLGNYCFRYCYSLKNISLAKSNGSSISQYAFFKCYSLERIIGSSNITMINQYAFQNCISLKTIAFIGSLQISNYAFENCTSLYEIIIPKVHSIYQYVFQNCSNIKKIDLPNTIRAINSYAFQNCYSLETIDIPLNQNYTFNINSYAFANCTHLKSVSMGNNISGLGIYAFYNCISMREITLSNIIKSLATNVFYNCNNLQSIVLHEGITTIGVSSIENCYSLKEITIPSTVTTISGNAFSSCLGLSEIHFKRTTPPTISNSNAFNALPTDCIIYVPSGSLTDYTTAANYPSSATYTYVEE